MKSSLKKILIGVLVFLILAGGFVFFVVPSEKFRFRLGNRLAERWKQEVAQIYKEDIDGGKTPRQTYEMFVSALKQENIELASKYFVLSKQEDKLKEFEEMRDKRELKKYIDGLPGWGEMKEEIEITPYNKEFRYQFYRETRIDYLPGGESGQIKVESPAGYYKASIFFRLNTQSQIWKIENL